jgi:chaperone modulatory protein CbpM
MIDIEALFTQVSGLDPDDLERWILKSWVRPAGNAGRYEFREIDVARVRLIRELRDELQVNEDALPVVLLLLDQLHDLRRRMREVSDAIAVAAPEQTRRELRLILSAQHL